MAGRIDKRNLKDDKTGDIIAELEYLPCEHQNNLRLQGRVSGVCPKCKKMEQPIE